jgi:flavin-binding protein dodecin
MALAMAEQMKAENGAIKNQIDQYRAETDRIDVMAKVQETGVNIDYKKVQTQSMKLNDAMKLRQSVTIG